MLTNARSAAARRNGIGRVVAQTARAFTDIAGVQFDPVRYDDLLGHLRYLSQSELDTLYGAGDWPARARLRLESGRIGRPFGEQVAAATTPWLLAPEVAWHESQGRERFARTLTQCREDGISTCAIFYDMIPLKNDHYREGAAGHLAYADELLRCDAIAAISRFSAAELAEEWRKLKLSKLPRLTACPLPDGGFFPDDKGEADAAQTPPSPFILLVGAIEPRKRQIPFLKAFAEARAAYPSLRVYHVLVAGPAQPKVADAFADLCLRHRWIVHLSQASDRLLASLYLRAQFTVFASEDEGYGLPVAESLAAGTPCLCANFGSMAEIAAEGGCLTVDVRDPAALSAGLVALCEDEGLRQRLRSEIAQRRFRTWRDYAEDLRDVMASPVTLNPAQVRIAPWPHSDPRALQNVAEADVVELLSPDGAATLMAQAVASDCATLLPSRLGTPLEAVRLADDLAGGRQRQIAIAEIEATFAQARRASTLASGPEPGQLFLRIVISTYNRRDFVLANVKWIVRHILPQADDIELVVVDGASPDGTLAALEAISHPRLRTFGSPTNVGMLAGIREASHLLGAEYVWVIGDDDFIDRAQFTALLAGLRRARGVPFGVVNFSVYHRARLSAGDDGEALLTEAQVMARTPIPTGGAPTARIAEQTDNLFTAIYTILWRADVLAAAVNRPYDRAAFFDLAHAAPSTELILRSFGLCEAYWHAASAIAGNAHNSWSQNRPRWHGVAMAEAFGLARDVGVDPILLQRWADLHRSLLSEALVIARREQRDPGVDELQLEPAALFFRASPAEMLA